MLIPALVIVAAVVIGVVITYLTTPKGAPMHPLVQEHLDWLKSHPEHEPQGGMHSL